MKQFTETSSEPYDRHHYRVWMRDGSFKDVESYDEVQRVWYSSQTRPKTIEVMQAKRRGSAKGFLVLMNLIVINRVWEVLL